MTDLKGTIRRVDYPGAHQHASYYLLKVDLEHTLKCVDVIIANDLDVSLLTALFSGAVIAYSRCFVSGRGSKLNVSEIFKGNPKNPLVFHETIIGLRHRVYAHRDSEIDGAYFGPIVSDARPAKIMGFGNLTAELVSLQKHDMEQFHELIGIVLDHVNTIRPVGRRDRGQLGATWQQPIKQGVEMTDENPELEDIPIDRTEAFNNLGAAVAAFIDLGMRQLKPSAEAAVNHVITPRLPIPA